MPRTISIEDLVDEEKGKKSGGDLGATFERILDKLEETGRLDELIDAFMARGSSSSSASPQSNPVEGDDGNVDADTLINALKQVYDFKGNISLKELIKLAEGNKGMIEKVL